MIDRRMLHFLALAEELHYGRAAEKLHITQPALSGSVKNLELSLGLQLVRRNGRRVELTGSGGLLAEQIRDLKQQADDALTIVRNQSAVTGSMRIGFAPTVHSGRIASLISEVRSHPTLSQTAKFVSLEASMHVPLLEAGKLDASLVVGPVKNRSITVETLMSEPLNVVYASVHCLASPNILRLEDLKAQPMIWLRRDLEPYAHDHLVAQCAAYDRTLETAQEVSTFEQCHRFALRGLGITFLPSSMINCASGVTCSDSEFGPTALHLDVQVLYRKHDRSDLLSTHVRNYGDVFRQAAGASRLAAILARRL